MKFWQKAFFSIIGVFLLGFNIISYQLAKHSYDLIQSYVLQSAETEQQVIKKSVSASVSIIAKKGLKPQSEDLRISILPYVSFYKNQGIYFRLYENDTLIFDNLPVQDNRKQYSVPPGKQVTEVTEVQGRLFCFIASYLNKPYDNVQFVYIKDLQPLVQYKENIITSCTIVGILTSFVLQAFILILLIFLTKPFRTLNSVAKQISMGHYDKRVNISSHDEIGDFAKSFNAMADHIQDHIEELSQMSESKQRFINNLAHEIRTPITAVLGYAELLKYANCNDEEKIIALDHIISQSNRIQNMVYKLMDLAYMSSNNIVIRPLNIVDLIEESLSALDFRIQEKHIIVEKHLQPLTINGDKELLESLVVNLLDNAIKASYDGGIIKIRIYSGESGAFIEITDNGKGIEKTNIDKLTEPFYRADKSRNRNEGGVGLGLSICAKICELHKAQLKFLSEVGKGTTVTIGFTTL
jgi:signal transduction histidine kinase